MASLAPVPFADAPDQNESAAEAGVLVFFNDAFIIVT
jgi:hypothetical protein